MTVFLKWIATALSSGIDMLDSWEFEFFTFNISFLDILCAVMIICFVISVFWKGAKS